MSDKLSDCPFCGGPASSSQQTNGGRWAAYCLDCNAIVDGEFSESDAIAAWNRRASPAPAIPAELRGLLVECRENLDRLGHAGIRERLTAQIDAIDAAPAISESDQVVVPARVVELLRIINRDGVLKRATELQEVYRLIDAARKGEKS
ncbi:Lar family restriction alleviation protein [Burkholderia gladioli]|uniref:Lar family restriction alleviation protein n=1 Tax=Burkholderia gladioli TaxID=28095 RepID=A0AB38TM38_BURGA|nr:Lar family restriction alleviation protein [Burkholderia gladioli]UWX68866.1 Lar family restriction alleviation protein [Burkholderia gladioli]